MLGARIAVLRRQAGLSQNGLAQRLRISPSAVGMYEQGRREPSLDTVVAMAEIFGVSTDYLLTGRIPPREQQALMAMLEDRIRSARQRTGRRRDPPFTARELAVLFAAVLEDPT